MELSDLKNSAIQIVRLPHAIAIGTTILLSLGSVASFVLYQLNGPLAAIPILSAVFLSFLAVGASEYRENETPEGFFLYERKMPIRLFAWTYVAANVGLFSSIFYSLYLAHFYGPAGMIWPTLAWVVGMYWFYSCSPKIKTFFKTGQSIHEFIGNTFGANEKERLALRRYTSFVTMTLLWASIAIEVKFGASVIASIVGTDAAFPIAAIIASLATYYSYLSGYRGATRTDFAQGMSILLGAFALVGFAAYLLYTRPWHLPPEYKSISGILLGPSWISVLGMVVLLLPYQFCVMDMWQRYFAISVSPGGQPLEDYSKSAKWYLFTSPAIIFCTLFAAWFFIATSTKFTGLCTHPDQVISSIIELLAASGGFFTIILLFALIAFASAIMSTFDTFLVGLTQVFMFDWYGPNRPKLKSVLNNNATDDEKHKFVNTSRFWTGILGLSAVALAAFDFSLISFWVGMYSLMLSFFPAVYLGIMHAKFCKRYVPARVASASILIAFTLSLVCGVLGTFGGVKIFETSISDINSIVTLTTASLVLVCGVFINLMSLDAGD